MNLIAYSENLQKQAAPPSHWYLWGLAVDPPRQGYGIGAALMQPALSVADETRRPCYLETTNPDNQRFYERLEFQVAAEGGLPKGGPHIWALVREPR